MALIIIDTITSILLSIAFVYTISNSIDRKGEVNRKKIFVMTLLFFAINEILIGIFATKWVMSIFLIHVLYLTIITILCKEKIHNIVVAYTISYLIFIMYFYIFQNLNPEYIVRENFIKGIISRKFLACYVIKLIFILIYFQYIEKIKKANKFINYEKVSIILILVSFMSDFILTSCLFNYGKGDLLIGNIICVISLVFFMVALVYFWKVYQKSEQIYRLNEALEIKNNELRKIKHDYGAQISYLYGLCLMKRFDDLKKSLRDIINNNEVTPTAVEVSPNDKSVLSKALKPAIDMGIHVIIEEMCEYSFIDLTQMEFYKVLLDIVNNAIKAMNGEGIIIAKSYEYLGNAVIKIENNRSKVHEIDFDKVLKFKFLSTESDDDSNGYGLGISRELIERCNGKISVKSRETAIEFKITLPIYKR